MASLAPRELKIRTIVDKTLGVVEYSVAAVLLYIVGLAAIDFAITYYSLDITAPMQQSAFALLKFAVGIVGAYLVLSAMVRKTGLYSGEGGETFSPYVALSLLSTLGILAGFVLFVIPGLLILARWSIAQPMLVARGGGVMNALGESWGRTKGNEFSILVAALALLIVPIAIAIACGVLFEKTDVVGIAVSQLATTAISAMILALNVALYGLLVGGGPASNPAN